MVVPALLLLAIVGATATDTVMLPMRDGVKLHTLIDKPASSDNGMTSIMDRSPYSEIGTELMALVGLKHAMAGVRQDMRGTQKSQGNFSIWHSDANDAYDTMKWISQQSWSNGKVLSVGPSADGLAAIAEIRATPQWLSGLWTIWASSVGHEIVYSGGTYAEALTDFWMKSTVPKEADRCIKEIKSNEAPNAWWDALNMTGQYGNVKFPSRFWAGWYDIFLVGNIAAYDGFQNQADPAWRGQSKITIDPLGHCQGGAKFFPKNLVEGRVMLPVYQGMELITGQVVENVQAITFYVMGSNDTGSYGNYWTSMSKWPQYKPVDFYFHRDGSLTNTPEKNPQWSFYTFNPTKPVPTIGGNNLQLPCGPLDQRSIEAPNRPDVLTYTSDVLTQPLVITGPINAVLYVASNCTDTDFMVKITDVYPTGESRLIQDGAVRMRWRNVANSNIPQLLSPGQIYEATVSLWNSSYVWSPGHRVRVSVSSSNSPRYGVNPNNGQPLVAGGPIVWANNTVFTGPKYLSRIVLPVVSFSDLPEVPVKTPHDEEYLGNPKNLERLLRMASLDEATLKMQQAEPRLN